MLSHLVLPYKWVECESSDDCDRSTHLDTSIVVNAPPEWIAQFMGNCQLKEWEFTWLDEDGCFHRDDGPAVENIYRREWYQHGVLHRDDGPAVMYFQGSEEWYVNGEAHRVDGPAMVWTHEKRWMVQGKLHRIGGPAIEREGGQNEWYEQGVCYRTAS